MNKTYGVVLTDDGVNVLQARLGDFVLTFQAVEAAMVELTVQIVDGDPEYVASLVAELEFSAKARALDVIYTRFAQIHNITEESPEPRFHKLAGRILNLAQRRNELLHSFYSQLTTVDGALELRRQPTRLKPSKGLRTQAEEEIPPDHLVVSIQEMQQILKELEGIRLSVVEAQYPAQS